MLAAAKSHIERLGRTAKVRGVIWMGGEQDGVGAVNVTNYKADLVELRDRFRTATGIEDLPLLIVSLDDNATYPTNYANIRQAQSEAASENDGIELIVPFQDFLDAGELTDGVHYSQTALNTVGELAAASCATLFPHKAMY
jgi:hypothetical protein